MYRGVGGGPGPKDLRVCSYAFSNGPKGWRLCSYAFLAGSRALGWLEARDAERTIAPLAELIVELAQ